MPCCSRAKMYLCAPHEYTGWSWQNPLYRLKPALYLRRSIIMKRAEDRSLSQALPDFIGSMKELKLKANLVPLALASLALTLVSCVSPMRSQESEASGGASDLSGELIVFAAASLTESFDALGAAFEAKHPLVDIRFNYGGSQQLAQQLVYGAPADIFASANETQMGVTESSGRILTQSSVPFAANRLVVALPADNPAAIETVSDLSRPGIKLIIAAEEVPVGRYTQQFLTQTRSSPDFDPGFADDLIANVVSYEQNVRAVLSKVLLGEADAGIVYTSDIAQQGSDQVSSVAISESVNVVAGYFIAPLNNSGEPELANSFIEFVRSPEGQSILEEQGFLRAADLKR